MAVTPSFLRHRRRRLRSRAIGALLWLLSRPGYLMVWAMFTCSDLGERLNAHLGDWSWRDIVGSLLLFPVSIGLFIALAVGFRTIAHAFGVMP